MQTPRWPRARLCAALLAIAAVVPLEGRAGAQGGPLPDHVQAFGGAAHLGSLDTLRTEGQATADEAITSFLPTDSGSGYWIVLADGSVYAFGDAGFFGSIPGLRGAGVLIEPAVVVVSAARTPTGHGYWLADDRGGVYAFGDAGFFGSIPGLQGAGIPVGSPTIAAIASSPTGHGYWLADDRGSVYAFGDAGFFGSIPGLRGAGVLIEPAVVVVSAARTPTGHGYWLADDRGGVYAFGDAGFFGSAAPESPDEAVVGFAPTAAGDGYRVLTADGRVRSYGNAPDHGSATVALAESALALAASPVGTGYWVLTPQDRPAAGAPSLPPGAGSGRRIVYSNSRQRIWLVEGSGVVTASWAVSGRRGVPGPGTYHVFSKSPASAAHGGSLRLANMVRFAHGRSLAIGFHAIPTAGGRPIQGLDELGQYRSAGCVRQAPGDAARLYTWAPLGTTVVVTP